MAQVNGPVLIPHDNYAQWRNAVLGNGYNYDYTYGNQCWDLCAELWYQYGLTLFTGPSGDAYECWTVSADRNAVNPFTKVTNVTDIKRGDCIVIRQWGSNSGHIAFADEDYNGSDHINVLGQNQGQGSAAPSNIASMPLTTFLGAFRNGHWVSPTPPKPESVKKKKFPWCIAFNHWNY